MMLRIIRWIPSFVLVACFGCSGGYVEAFVSFQQLTTFSTPTRTHTRRSPASWSQRRFAQDDNDNKNDAQAEAAALLERARQMRAEIAALTGTSVEALEQEAALKRQQQQQSTKRDDNMDKATTPHSRSDLSSHKRNVILPVPETPDEQVWQAKGAVERAFAANHTRQVVRFALVPADETLNQRERSWPGGAPQMYRRAAGPLTRQLLRQLRLVTRAASSSSSSATSTAPAISNNDKEQQQQQQQQQQESDVPAALWKQPQVTSRDVWDFDGSAVITAEHPDRPSANVQALVFPNTDNKYINDIQTMDQAMGREQLFLLVNPFWRNLDSWGYNLLAPRAQANAQRVIFGGGGGGTTSTEEGGGGGGGFVETYCVLQKSVRGEDCVALKAYPYDWQLYAYAESNDWPYAEYTVHLGSTVNEPTSTDFAERLAQREEFRLGKTMRQMQRRMKQ